jgi:hypothetical protein
MVSPIMGLIFAVFHSIPTNACETGVIFACDLTPNGHISLCLHNDTVTMDLVTNGETVSASEPLATVEYQPWNGIGSTDSAMVTLEVDGRKFDVATGRDTMDEETRELWSVSVWQDTDADQGSECTNTFAGDVLTTLWDEKILANQCWSRHDWVWKPRDQCVDEHECAC